MIQFNLLPDIKLEYMRAQRTKRVVMLISIAVTSAAFLLFVLLFVNVKIVQKGHIKNLSNDIRKSSSDLKGTSDINKVLTIQNQLNSLPGIHDQKTNTTRLLGESGKLTNGNRVAGFIEQITPANVSISSLEVDFVEHKMIIVGSAVALVDVNRYVDTLKFTDYKNEEDVKEKAFSEVVLTDFSSTDKGTTYSVSFRYADVLFDNTKKISLEVPNLISTRSEQEKPKLLFTPNENGGTQ